MIARVQKIKTKNKLILFILLLLMTSFFGAFKIRNTYLLILILPFIAYGMSRDFLYKKQFVLMLFGLTMSIISCNYFRNQSILLSFQMTAPFYYIFFYFFLKYIKIPLSKIENVLFYISIIFCLCYIFQYIIFPTAIFSGAKAERLSRDSDLRIRLVAQGFSSLGLFYGLNIFLIRKKLKYLILSIFCFSVILLMGFRTMLVLVLLFSFILIFRIKGLNIKTIRIGFLGILLIVILFQFSVFSIVFERMIERSESQTFFNSDYIRIIQFKYFVNEHFHSFWEYIWGSGVPAIGANNEYARYMEQLLNSGINYVDLGLLSLSWIVGFFTVLAMIAYSLKVVFLKVNKRHYYIGTWFLYLILISFTTSEFFRPGNFIVQAIALYIAEYAYRQNKYLIQLEKKQNENRCNYLS